MECVAVRQRGEVVVASSAGSTCSSCETWKAKVVRTLTGHRSNVISVDFHPFEEFFASGPWTAATKNLVILALKGC